MTYENVLNVFSAYLTEDADIDVIQTRQGYTVLGWDEKNQGWERADYCGTPQALCETLTDAFSTFAELNTTRGLRELTKGEERQIEEECRRLKMACEELTED